MLKIYGQSTSLGVFLALVLALGCKTDSSLKTPLTRPWYTQVMQNQGGDYYENQALLARFYPNGTYTLLSYTGYSHGTWQGELNEEGIKLLPRQTSGMAVAKLIAPQFATTDSLFMLQYLASNEPEEFALSMKAMPLSNDDDPFTWKKNQWRRKPDQPETPEELRNRVLDHLSFLQEYYQWALDNKLPYLPTDWYPTAFNMNYSNGVRMAYADELAGWNSCFFDSTQAVEAYKILSGPMRKVKLDKELNNYARNKDCIKQLISAIE